MDGLRQWAFQVLIAFDQLVNALIPGGWSDETLSSRAARLRAKGHKYWGWTASAIDALFFWQKNPGHCDRAMYAEEIRAQLPPALRGTPKKPSYWDDEWQS